MRRIKRDGTERGRTPSEVMHQYNPTVCPMHLEFVERSKRAADIIVGSTLGSNSLVAIKMISNYLTAEANIKPLSSEAYEDGKKAAE